MSEVASMLSARMTGDLQTLKTKYNLAYYQSNNEYEIRVTPKTANAMMQSITLHMRKTDKMLTRMRIMEKRNQAKRKATTLNINSPTKTEFRFGRCAFRNKLIN